MVDGYDQVHESNEERRNNYSCPYLLSDWVFNANDTDAGQITDHLILHVPVGLWSHRHLVHSIFLTCSHRDGNKIVSRYCK